MERMLNVAASSCCASESTLPKTMPPCFSDAASNTGAKPLQGPHHDAQKSTRTMSFLVTTSSKLSFVSSTVAIKTSKKLCHREHRAHRDNPCLTVGISAGSR